MPQRNLLRFSVGLIAMALGACAYLRPEPACGPVRADTAGWREFRSRSGAFSLMLPAGAREEPLQCIDSDCGRIAVGRWTLHYDGGRMAGPGDSLQTPLNVTDVRVCAARLAGRRGHVMTARMQAPSAPGHDHIAIAALPIAKDEGGLYLRAEGLTEAEVTEFDTAVRSLRIFLPPNRP